MRANHGIQFRNISLLRCIAWAWQVNPTDVVGPAWLETARYDIAAKREEDFSAAEQLRLAFQALLEERLNLKVHIENKSGPTWVLRKAKATVKMPPGSGDSLGFRLENGALSFHNITMGDLAKRLPRFFRELSGEPVIDDTELTGTYNVTLKLAPNDEEAQALIMKGGDGAIFSLLRDQLGLELKREKSMIDKVIVDHIERTPLPN
jgi:uncharacterized protein (TIGR03435 family)